MNLNISYICDTKDILTLSDILKIMIFNVIHTTTAPALTMTKDC